MVTEGECHSPLSCREFDEIVGGAQERPFLSGLVDAAEQELTEAAGCFDLSEYGFDDVLA